MLLKYLGGACFEFYSRLFYFLTGCSGFPKSFNENSYVVTYNNYEKILKIQKRNYITYFMGPVVIRWGQNTAIL